MNKIRSFYQLIKNKKGGADGLSTMQIIIISIIGLVVTLFLFSVFSTPFRQMMSNFFSSLFDLQFM